MSAGRLACRRLHCSKAERIVSAIIHAPWGDVEIHTVHLPTCVGQGWTKVETFEGIVLRLAHPSTTPRILCGDFNSPQSESSGQIATWGQDLDANGHGTPAPRSGR